MKCNLFHLWTATITVAVGFAGVSVASAESRDVPAQYSTIQAAIDVAVAGDVVVIGPGLYQENIAFRGKAITVRSSDGPATTTIDGRDLREAVNLANGEHRTSVLEGLTIIRGGVLIVHSEPTIRFCVFTQNNRRPAISMPESGPLIQGCTFTKNLRESGTGDTGLVESFGQNLPTSPPEIRDCVFSENADLTNTSIRGICIFLADSAISAMVDNCTFAKNAAAAGVVFIRNGNTATLRNCMFSQNTAAGYAGACYIEAGARPTLQGCSFVQNSSSTRGGAAFIGSGAHARFVQCEFSGNRAPQGGALSLHGDDTVVWLDECQVQLNEGTHDGGGARVEWNSQLTARRTSFNLNTAQFGAGVSVDHAGLTCEVSTLSGNVAGAQSGGIFGCCESTMSLTDCLISDNRANVSAGAISLLGARSVSLVNCTVVANVVDQLGVGGIAVDGSLGSISNSIVFFNRSSSGPSQLSGNLNISYSDIQGGYAGVGNIDSDPRFTDLATGDYRIVANSPCLDAGDNASVTVDMTTDLDGRARLLDGDGDGNAIVDMGAYELFQDCNHNGIADSRDVVSGTSRDCNGNTIPDECEVPPLGSADNDRNLNGIPDSCEIVRASWQMRQGDMGHTGRASFEIPPQCMNSGLFDVIAWQKRSPGSPGGGWLSCASMVFYDGAGPDHTDIVVGAYQSPGGLQGMDRHSGKLLWSGSPGGGQLIGRCTPAFSNDGRVMYTVNESTESPQWPSGHPLMAFSTVAGPSTIRHNGATTHPEHLAMWSPTISPDGRIFLHAWADRVRAGTDTGSSITESWEAGTDCWPTMGDPSLYQGQDYLSVVTADTSGWIKAYHGQTGAELWATRVGVRMDTTPTVDPANGSMYVGGGEGSVFVVGLDRDGKSLWSQPAIRVYEYVPGSNNPQYPQTTGCLSHDGGTYYFQTGNLEKDGRLFAVNTATGQVRWSCNTGSGATPFAWQGPSPIVTPNGVVILGTNDSKAYLAVQDMGTQGVILDRLETAPAGNASSGPALSPDGLLYLPLLSSWTVGNGDGEIPTGETHYLFTAIDLTANATHTTLYPPTNLAAHAKNRAVLLTWKPVANPRGAFAHYAVYRDTISFNSVAGKTPIATVEDVGTGMYLDTTAENGISYYYAVTSVADSGREVAQIQSIGPRTPWDETDLQVVSISRNPLYPRFAPSYVGYQLSEPSGFGPYITSATVGLANGQDANTQRWPAIGAPVTYTATVRNRGSNSWLGNLAIVWRIDGEVVDASAKYVTLDVGESASFARILTWDGQSHDVRFSIENGDDRQANNALSVDTHSVAFLSYIDRGYLEKFREESRNYPQAATDDYIDWLNRQMERFNGLFAEARSRKRVHFDTLAVLEDGAPTPTTDQVLYAIFPLRYLFSDPTFRTSSGYYRPNEDIDYGLLHEMGHQLGLIDLYQLDISLDQNEVSTLGYMGPESLMHSCDPLLDPHSAAAMDHWYDKAHGYFGQYLYSLPDEVKVRFLGWDGRPLPGARVTVYQRCTRPTPSAALTAQVKAQGVTDGDGLYTLPNVPVDPAMFPPTYVGDVLRANPFGFVDNGGASGVLHFRVDYGGGTDYAWLDITEANLAYWRGAVDRAIFDRSVGLGGPPQRVPPNDMTEMSATDWGTYLQGSPPQRAYVEDDQSRKRLGIASVKFVTDGGFDSCLRYPRTFTSMWDLTTAQELSMGVYVEDSWWQAGPIVYLKDSENNYFRYEFYANGYPVNLLDSARGGKWVTCRIPLDASAVEPNGWRRTVHGAPDLKRIQYIEIHVDAGIPPATVWFDSVGFLPHLRAPADFDGDGDVDRSDYDFFSNCVSGPAIPRPIGPVCLQADLDSDGDVDQVDFGLLQRCYSGRSAPADPTCLNDGR